MSRRHFLWQSAGGIGAIALAWLLNEEAGADPLARPHFAPKAKRVVQIFCCGGVSHLDTFDFKPGLDGTVKTISRPIGAWTMNWRDLPHNQEVRWPYVFVSAYEDGVWVFNMMDPTNPYTVGYYFTYEGPHQRGSGGVFGIDVRNADGLIVGSDMHTGFWAFHLDGFDGWNGHQWGLPNVSSVQDWDNGPEGAPKGKVS